MLLCWSFPTETVRIKPCWNKIVSHVILQWSCDPPVVMWFSSDHVILQWSCDPPVVMWFSVEDHASFLCSSSKTVEPSNSTPYVYSVFVAGFSGTKVDNQTLFVSENTAASNSVTLHYIALELCLLPPLPFSSPPPLQEVFRTRYPSTTSAYGNNTIESW